MEKRFGRLASSSVVFGCVMGSSVYFNIPEMAESCALQRVCIKKALHTSRWRRFFPSFATARLGRRRHCAALQSLIIPPVTEEE